MTITIPEWDNLELQHLCCSAYMCETPVDGQGQICDECKKRASEDASRFKEKYGMQSNEMHALLKPLFLWMYDQGVQEIHISRHDKRALITIDGYPLG